ncbi:Mov34/MPN/PAD-1 family protein [Aeromicrobium fastidiosum]|jgi:integrative and conjugative element protein (TIGR02256 family)|uniref:Mov34/MPN/PAD-1 family protein n=1 Tax=Aeromicrobium fastidiosum TaxID=52699 RepID=UPI0020237B49|nr:Mov34/MPN/PAD-1 family protein [Aeromicrobium fastidiosum]MCL8250368.1 Mov34/MPN/PAD-1 family protein [Aeromicrobium fastidiosum]
MTNAVEVSEQAASTLRVQARRSTKHERGGILIGYRANNRIVVYDALVVEDPQARYAQYTRRSEEAQRELDAWMSCSDDPLLGYVGEWHTHPEPVPPSATDRAAAAALALRSKEPLALLVAALQPTDRTVILHALITGSGPTWARLVKRAQVCDIVFS